MNVQDYYKQRQALTEEQPRFRQLCLACFQPPFSCYCAQIRRFDSHIKFVILIHPIEARRRIATGRMSYLCLENSHLIKGQDYSTHSEVNELIENPDHYPVILYPDPDATNLSNLTESERQALVPSQKQLVIFVIDGTWGTAGRTLRQSANLSMLPRLCFSPVQLSNFRVRKQPRPGCYATIEAIHHTIELLGPSRGFDTDRGSHNNLLEVFNGLVNKQVTMQKATPDQLRKLAKRAMSPPSHTRT